MDKRQHTLEAPKMDWGPSEPWMGAVNYANRSAIYQSYGALHRQETRNHMHNANRWPRENLQERRARMEAVGHPLKHR